MTEVLRAARDLQAFCDARGWRSCLIGGLALLRWGEPRETIDVDLTLLSGFGEEERFVIPLLEAFRGRIERAAAFALEHRVLLLEAPSGVGLDIALGALPFEAEVVARSSRFDFTEEISLRTCSAEDLIVLKCFAARTKDWLDVEGVIVRQTGALDWNYVETRLRPLVELKSAPEILVELERRRREFES